ncbi:hypothetical protein V6N13_043053 [Hibiscus sabdariffa]|uniref:Uncharacterized protein n=1 Tax=Hibiscus sabdariffa TaxID=183260 RepID=A0ABR2G2X9_9ROSI
MGDQENKTSIDANNVNHNEIEGQPQNENVAKNNVVVENVVDENLDVQDFVEGGSLVEALIEERCIIREDAIVGNLVVEEIGRDCRPVVQSRLHEESIYNLAMSMYKEDSVIEPETCLVDEGGFEGSSMLIVDSSDGSNDNVCLKALRRSKQSLKRPKVEAVDNLECEQQTVENVLVSNFGGEESAEESRLTVGT